MARKPTVGGDSGNWGDILNDFLDVEHDSNGSLKTGSGSTLSNYQPTSAKGQANGYAPLDGTGKVPSANLPAQGSVPDADASNKGVVQLTGDLSGTASSPTVPGLAGKASDASVVHLSGTETVTGNKNFTGSLQHNGQGVVDTTDSRLSDARTPSDGSVTDAKITSGGLTNSAISSSANIAKSKLAALNIGDADVSAISESKVTNLTTDLGGKVAKSSFTAKGDLLAGTASATSTNVVAGSDGQVLTSDSTQSSGLKWQSAVNPYDYMKPTGVIRETRPRVLTSQSSTGILTAGTLRATAIPLLAGEIITSISFEIGTDLTPGSDTHQWACLLDSSLNVLMKTNDDGNNSWIANTNPRKTFTLTGQYTVTTDGLYYIGIVISWGSGTTGTLPQLRGGAAGNSIDSRTPAVTGNSTSGLTNPASLGATAASFASSSSGNAFYATVQ